ncbi:MAG: DUF3107 domain-containing protein [Acidimicrobiia bacterium]
MIEVKIGVIQHPHEIDLEIDSSSEDLVKTIEEAISQDKALVFITDSKGNKVGVPASKLAFIEIKSADDVKRVGFGI